MLRYIWLIVLLSIAISTLAFSFSSSAYSLSQDNSTVLQQAQKALEANQNQASSTLTDSSQEASKITKGSGTMSTYENNDYGISIRFPNNWKPSEVNLPRQGIVLFYAPAFGTPLSEDYLATPAAVLVASQKLPVNNLTLPKFVESFLKDRYPNVEDYKIISSSKSNLGGMQSEQIIMYEYDNVNLFSDGGSLKLKRNIAIDNKSEIAYMIRYVAEPGMFSKYLPLADQMIDSFKLVNKP
jgi:hypothetical protein